MYPNMLFLPRVCIIILICCVYISVESLTSSFTPAETENIHLVALPLLSAITGLELQG